MKDFLVKFEEAQNNEKVDLIEIWFDQIEDLNLEEIFRFRKKPLIAVIKEPKEFGAFTGSHAKKIALLSKFIELGGDFVDLSSTEDFQYFNGLKKEHKFQIIGSFHDFKNTPSQDELFEVIDHRAFLEVDIIKIATKVENEEDLKILGSCVKRIVLYRKKAIVIGMGDLGKTTRLGEGAFRDNFLTFVALSKEEKTAPGQIMLNDILL